MAGYEHSFDLAVTSEGTILAILDDNNVMPFSTIEDLGGFVHIMKSKLESYRLTQNPLNEVTAKQVAKGAIEELERCAASLVPGDNNNPGTAVDSLGSLEVEDNRSLRDTVREFFVKEDWGFEDKGSHLSMGIIGKNGDWHLKVFVSESGDNLSIYSYLPIFIMESRRMEMAEFLARTNYGMVPGNFEMDFDDGEVRLKSSVSTYGIRLPDELIRKMVNINCGIMDEYLPQIMRLLYADVAGQSGIDGEVVMPV